MEREIEGIGYLQYVLSITKKSISKTALPIKQIDSPSFEMADRKKSVIKLRKPNFDLETAECFYDCSQDKYPNKYCDVLLYLRESKYPPEL